MSTDTPTPCTSPETVAALDRFERMLDMHMKTGIELTLLRENGKETVLVHPMAPVPDDLKPSTLVDFFPLTRPQRRAVVKHFNKKKHRK